MRPKILFICDKWCEGKKSFGISEWEVGVQKSLEALNIADLSVFNLDDYYIQNGKKGDEALLQKIKDEKPNLVFLILYKMPGTDFNVPEFSTLDEIKNHLKIPVEAMWVDPEVAEQVKISLATLPYTTFNFATTSSAAIARINNPEKFAYTWVPKDPRVFNNPNKERDIDISYIGSPKSWRLKKINYLKKNGVNIIHGGGERQEHLTTEQYADRYQRSKITLSFSRASASHATNARPFEAMACGTMLLEQESFETMKLYTPYVDYVPYSNNQDLLKKTKYYLAHDEEREKIARNGQRKTEKLYSAKRFWEIAIKKAMQSTAEKTEYIAYDIPQESLNNLPKTTALKMKFLNNLCKTNAGFMIFKIFNVTYWRGSAFTALSKMKPAVSKLLPKKVFESMLKFKRKIY